LPSGIYLLKVIANNEYKTIKVVKHWNLANNGKKTNFPLDKNSTYSILIFNFSK
jgi:hypothetical protein